MSQLPPWVPALKISETEYLEWLKSYPSPDFILSWAIENKRIDEKMYLKWASSYYKLPVVKAEFFNDPPPLDVWKKHLAGPWNPTALPLYEWNGTLFVGVLEPPKIPFGDSHIQLVLSAPSVQNKWWTAFYQLQKFIEPVEVEKAEVLEIPERPVAPFGLQAEITHVPAAQLQPETAETPESAATVESAGTLSPIPEVAIPQEASVISDEINEILKPEKKIDLEPLPQVNFNPMDSDPLTPPDGISDAGLNLPPQAVGPEGVDLGLAALEPLPDPVPPNPSDRVPAGLEFNLELEAQLQPGPPEGFAPVVSDNSTQGLSQAPKKMEKIDVVAKSPSLPPPPSAAPSPRNQQPPPPPPPDENLFEGIPEGSIKVTLDKLKNNFERSMVLLFQEGTLRPYQWDQSWPVVRTEKGEIDLAAESVFKIVVDSKHPFHGAPRSSPPCDAFFKKWNQGSYPAHVTALPLKARDEVFGILIGIASAEKSQQIALPELEFLASNLSADLAKAFGAAA